MCNHWFVSSSKKARLVDKGRAMDAVYLELSKAFNAVSHNLLVDKLMMYRLRMWAVLWTENWLKCWTQGLVISSSVKSGWGPVSSGISQEGQIGFKLGSKCMVTAQSMASAVMQVMQNSGGGSR